MFATAVGLRYRAPDTGRFRALRMGKFRKGGAQLFFVGHESNAHMQLFGMFRNSKLFTFPAVCSY